MIPLSVPHLAGNEWKYIKECLDTNWVSSVGDYVNLFEENIAKYTGAKYAVSTVNGTAALHLSLLLAGVTSKDYVIVPNITFIASLNSIKYTNASPLLIDIDEKSWQMDLALLEDFLVNNTKQKNGMCIHSSTGRTIKAIMPVHVLGSMADMKQLLFLAKKYNLVIIEDATEALGSFYKTKHAGTFGMFGCLSFNGNKIITTGGGGMILTNNKKLAQQAKHLTTQAKSDPFEYIHDEIGFNYRMVNVLAAMGVAQLEQLPGFLKRKKQILELYKKNLEGLHGIEFQANEEGVNPNNWLVTIRCNDQKKLIQYLLKQNIQIRPFWKPMNKLKMFRSEIYITHSDISGQVYADCISLPCSSGISDKEIELVIKAIKAFYK